ncbi:unnamed protein product, partial [Prorocentrum cordatum]
PSWVRSGSGVVPDLLRATSRPLTPFPLHLPPPKAEAAGSRRCSRPMLAPDVCPRPGFASAARGAALRHGARAMRRPRGARRGPALALLAAAAWGLPAAAAAEGPARAEATAGRGPLEGPAAEAAPAVGRRRLSLRVSRGRVLLRALGYGGGPVGSEARQPSLH